MSDELKKFMELVSKDTGLQNEIKTYSKLSIEEHKNKVIELAKEKGILLKEEDFDSDKISDEELKDIAAASDIPCIGAGDGMDQCACIIVGAADGHGCFLIGG